MGKSHGAATAGGSLVSNEVHASRVRLSDHRFSSENRLRGKSHSLARRSHARMFPAVASISRVKAPHNRRQPLYYRIPDAKLRNVVCVLCKDKFYVPDPSNLNRSLSKDTLIPLLSNCGHPVCSKCINKEIKKNCPLCNKVLRSDSFQRLLPLNLYALGLILSSYHRPLENDDEEFSFCHRLSSQLRQIMKQGCCHECGYQANVNCPQCMVLYCYQCYKKIHGRALQNHTQIPIFNGSSDSSAAISNSCSPTCSEALSYFCNDCNVACCSNCTLCSHKLHNFVKLAEKNQTLISEFNETFMDIEETLMRVCQTKEKVRSAISSNTYKLQNSESVEESISQHFAYLHGVLQNMETRLISELHKQSDSLKNDLEAIELQLRTQEDNLKSTLQIASYVQQTFQKVDIRNVIDKLKEMADLPCHLMYKDVNGNQNATFTVDSTIVAAIEDHCKLEMPTLSSYSLMREDELPETYIVSPLSKKPRKTVFDKSLMLPVLKPRSLSPITTTKTEDQEEEEEEEEEKEEKQEQESVSKYEVEVTYVVNPSIFFVRKIAMKSKFLQLEKDIKTYGNEQTLDTSINVKQDDMCIVKQRKFDQWFRGRVIKVVNTSGSSETFYNVTYIDYGYEEYNIPSLRVREIPERLQVLPPQAIRCSLYGLAPKNTHWTNASINDFLKLTNTADCTMSIMKSTPDTLYVDLCVNPHNSNMGPQSMCSTMKIKDYARLDIQQNPEKKVLKTYVYKREELMLNKMTTVNVGWIDSPDRIYVWKASHKNKLLKMKAELTEYYEKETSANIIETPKKGLPCAIQLKDKSWQRCEIIEIINENQVNVFCVDWGRSMIQNRDTLRVIPHEYTMLEAQAIRMSLMYIMPEPDGNWRPEAVPTLKNLFSIAKCVMVNPRRKLEYGYIGLIYCNDYINDVSRQLKIAGVVNEYHTIGKFKNKSRNIPKFLKNTVLEKSDTTAKDLNISWDNTQNTENDKSMKDEISKDPFKVEVRIQRVVTPDCIYVAQTEYEQSNMKMILAMQKFYDSYHSEPRDNWNEGELCTVYSPKDKSYFRAKILKINSPTEVLVYFYDMGIEEMVTMNEIQALPSIFAKEMTYCFKVRLAGILPCGGTSTWPSLSSATLSEIIRDNAKCKFYITKPVQEEISDDAIRVELWVRQFKIPGPLAPTEIEINSINRMLVDKGVALPIKNYFAKADSILAAEFKKQLESNWYVPSEEEVKWFNKRLNESEIDDTIISQSDLLNSSIDILNPLASNAKSTSRECTLKFPDWLPPTEITEEVFHAVPTYVDNQCVVYLHSKKYNADVLHYIETELQTHCKKVKINKDKQWKVGELCIAQYHGDKKWYRGKIVKTSEKSVQVEFVDYGNVEECEIERVTDHVRLGHIPIQCTKCIISGLKPASPNGKWKLHDLDRIHALLVARECKVTVLQRQPAYLIVSITILRPWKCDLLLYLTNHMEMNIKIERKEWNDSEWNDSENEELKSLDTTRDVVIEADTSSGTSTINVTLSEDMISGNLMESSKKELFNKPEDKQMSDTESISSIDTNILNKRLICSTPQSQSDEEDCPLSYKPLIIPPETKYIELALCCNKDPITSFAQLAKNDDDMFPNQFRKHYLQFVTIMSELQTDTCNQPLIKSFAKNTPCIAKFTDDTWYRCIIKNSEKIQDSQFISLYYVDYGNYEHRKLNLSKNHNLHVPKEKWLNLPAMAIECTFWGLNFVSDDINLLASKLNEIYNQSVVAQIKEINNGNDLVVEIYKDKTCQKLFYAHLIEEGLYQFEKPREV